MERKKRSAGMTLLAYTAVFLLTVAVGGGCGFLVGELAQNQAETQLQPEDQVQSVRPPETEPTQLPQTEPTQPPTEPDWRLRLVNRWNPLELDYSVELAETRNGQQVDARILPELEEMLADANARGLYPVIASAYRSRETQDALFANRVQRCLNDGLGQEEAAQEAGRWVAMPGTSEHETGLALDIVAADYTNLDWAQEQTAEQQWLMENSWRYGFILRYPTEKTELTGIYYEPWHYRYVGPEAAEEIYNSGLCMEEYLAQWEK